MHASCHQTCTYRLHLSPGIVDVKQLLSMHFLSGNSHTFPLRTALPIPSDLEGNGHHGALFSLGHSVDNMWFRYNQSSQNIPFFHHSKWLRNGYVTQFRPSRVLLRTFPLELIPKISPTLEIAKLEECEPEAAGGHVAFKEDKSYWKMNLRERERETESCQHCLNSGTSHA